MVPYVCPPTLRDGGFARVDPCGPPIRCPQCSLIMDSDGQVALLEQSPRPLSHHLNSPAWGLIADLAEL